MFVDAIIEHLVVEDDQQVCCVLLVASSNERCGSMHPLLQEGVVHMTMIQPISRMSTSQLLADPQFCISEFHCSMAAYIELTQ